MENLKSKKIGWIGLGAMGTPMAKNLINAGYNLTVYNRTSSKSNKLVEIGAQASDSPQKLFDETDIVFLMISDDYAVKSVFNGDEGLLKSSSKGKVIINMSTVSPQISRDLAKTCNENGNTYVDAPVSGSIKQATDASLVIMVGADENTFKSIEPLLEVLGKKAFLIGSVGRGNETKLAVNLFLSIITQGLSEVVLFANELGVESNQILNVINEGGLSSPYVKAKSQAILHNEYPSAFSLKHMAKDLKIAKENNLNFALGNATFESFQNAKETLGDFDVMAIIKYLKSEKY
ncbi:MAG: NAD(P)-dependent oxidoreductase [Bacteroidetes bacterium]|nr:NAD(P)-dependent oxidoreductase [Bacteroidota bacterium]